MNVSVLGIGLYNLLIFLTLAAIAYGLIKKGSL